MIWYPGLESLFRSVDEGCSVCAQLMLQLPAAEREKLRHDAKLANEPFYFKLSTYRGMEVIVELSREIQERTLPENGTPSCRVPGIQIYLTPFEEDSMQQDPRFRRVLSNLTNGEDTLSKIRSWLTKCRTTHDICRRRKEKTTTAELPRRLIKLTSTANVENQIIKLKACRLVDTKEESTACPSEYITLSHQWGSQNLPTLTTDNMELWRREIPLADMSQTFLDAFEVAQRLEIPYVWIDSICIIQDGDNGSDWKEQALLMHRVYSNAVFNICASWSVESGHLFAPRNPENLQRPKITLNFDGGDTPTFIPTVASRGEVWRSEVYNSPLNSRGWVFQEQLLSAANVHFARDEVFFECLEMQASETMGMSLKVAEEYLVREWTFKSEWPVFDNGRGHDNWRNLVVLYTERDLTRQKDRAVALSGVAKHFQRAYFGAEGYVAGLWLHHLAEGMMWQAVVSEPRDDWHDRLKVSFSSSWASHRGRVKYYREVQSIICHKMFLVDVNCVRYRSSTAATTMEQDEAPNTDIFDIPTPQSVEIKATGFVIPMSPERGLEQVNRPKVLYYPEMHRHYPDTNPRHYPEMKSRHKMLGARKWPIPVEHRPDDIILDFHIHPSDFPSLRKEGRFFGMLWAHGIEYEGTAWFLLLELIDVDMKRYRRIGVHIAYGVKWPILKDFLNQQETKHDHQQHPGEEARKTGQRTIYIV